MTVACRAPDSMKAITIPQVAYHEAGHVIATGMLGGRVDRVEIFERPGQRIAGVSLVRGVAWVLVAPPRDAAVMAVSGAVAEARHLGIGWSRLVRRFCHLGNPDYLDFIAAAREWQRDMSGLGKMRAELLEEAIDDAQRLLDTHWPAVRAVAHALVRHRRLTGGQAMQAAAAAMSAAPASIAA